MWSSVGPQEARGVPFWVHRAGPAPQARSGQSHQHCTAAPSLAEPSLAEPNPASMSEYKMAAEPFPAEVLQGVEKPSE